MKFEIKLFNFFGTPVNLKLWFLLLFAFLDPSYVVAIFLSILAHELAHGYVAHKLGYYVHNIYVDLFNGAAEMDISQIHEKDSIKIVAAGPLINLFLGLVSLFTYSVIPDKFIFDFLIVNSLLFIFNILPIYPMDGGRLLRDGLYLLNRNRKTSRIISSWVSLIFSILLLIFCLYTSSIIMGIFSVLFIYFAIKELGWIS